MTKIPPTWYLVWRMYGKLFLGELFLGSRDCEVLTTTIILVYTIISCFLYCTVLIVDIDNMSLLLHSLRLLLYIYIYIYIYICAIRCERGAPIKGRKGRSLLAIKMSAKARTREAGERKEPFLCYPWSASPLLIAYGGPFRTAAPFRGQTT